MLAHRIHQNRSEGLDGDPKELRLADVRGLLRSSKISYKAIAEAANLNPSTVSNVASGDTANPHDNTINRIIKALGYRQVIVPEEIKVAAEVKPEPYWPGDILSRREKRRQERLGHGKKRGRRSRK